MPAQITGLEILLDTFANRSHFVSDFFQVRAQASHVGTPLRLQPIQVTEAILERAESFGAPSVIVRRFQGIHCHTLVKLQQFGQVFLHQKMRQRPSLTVRGKC